ncbi:hypothetical protein HN51_032505 [Arachis hypogaea]
MVLIIEYELPNQQRSFMTPSNSSSSTFKTLQFGDADKVLSSVSILKDTLQRKRAEKEATDKSLNGIFCPQEPVFHRKLESSEASECSNYVQWPSFREQIMDNLKDDRKRRSLDRYGSVSSAVSAMFLGCRMAEAKERKLTPSVPSDMQAVLKRKDSEQTKQIEDLQKQNKSWQMKKSAS